LGELAIFEVIPESGACLKTPGACPPPWQSAVVRRGGEARIYRQHSFLYFYLEIQNSAEFIDVNRRLAGFAATAILIFAAHPELRSSFPVPTSLPGEVDLDCTGPSALIAVLNPYLMRDVLWRERVLR